MKKQIVFIEFYSSVMIYKIAKLFQNKGYETVLIRLLEQSSSDKDFYDKAYDQVIEFNIKHSKKNIFKIIFSQKKNIKGFINSLIKTLKLKPHVVIGKGMPDLPIAFFKIILRNYPFIYFPYDIRNQGDIEFEKKKNHWLELKAERFLFENSDGIMHKGAPEELNPEYMNGRVLGDNIQLPKYQLAFHPYCSKEFIVPINKNKLSKKDGEMHFVYIGGVSKLNKGFYKTHFDAFEKVPENNIHLHLYFCNDTSKEFNIDEWEKFIDIFMKEFKYENKKYFHVHKSFNPKEIVKEISKYDFGIMSYKLLGSNGLEPKFSIGNKLSTYMEAGIPFIYRKNYPFLKRIIKKYGIGISWPENMDNIRKKFKSFDYEEFEKNVAKAREDFSMEKHFSELENFVKKIAESRKN